MASLGLINWPRGYKPTSAEWADAVNRVVVFLQEGMPASYIQTDGGGRVAVSISGDADTVGGYTALELIGGELPDLMQVMGIFFVPSSGLVLTGGEAAADDIVLDRVNVAGITALVKEIATGFVSFVELEPANVFTVDVTTTYYLDLAPNAVAYSWGTTHPVGDYTPIAEVTTDGVGQVAGVFDRRIMEAEILAGYDAQLTFPAAWLGDATIDDMAAPDTDTAAFPLLLSNLANRIRAITGAALWRSAPATTLAALNTAVGSLQTTVGGHTTSIGQLETAAQVGRIRSFLGV